MTRWNAPGRSLGSSPNKITGAHRPSEYEPRTTRKPTTQIALPPRFPGASDPIGEPPRNDYWGADWTERFKDVTIPPVPIFDEDMSSVEERSRKLVGQVRCGRKFEPAHPLVAKLLAHDEERRKEFAKQRHSLYAPKYDAGTARRRLLIINALFLTAARIGCRPLMNTSKYVEEPCGKRDLWITIGKAHVCFTIEPIKEERRPDRTVMSRFQQRA